MVGFFVLEHGSKNRKRPRWGASRLKKSTWQAYRSPASLGEDPLSVPAACGLYEIFHLKCSYCTFIVSNGVAAVKDCFVSEEAVPFFAVDLHEGDDGIFMARRRTSLSCWLSVDISLRMRAVLGLRD